MHTNVFWSKSNIRVIWTLIWTTAASSSCLVHAELWIQRHLQCLILRVHICPAQSTDLQLEKTWCPLSTAWWRRFPTQPRQEPSPCELSWSLDAWPSRSPVDWRSPSSRKCSADLRWASWWTGHDDPEDQWTRSRLWPIPKTSATQTVGRQRRIIINYPRDN